MKMRLAVATRILLSLAYTEQFSFPLKTQELYLRLITKESVSFQLFSQSLKLLVQKGLVVPFQNYFFITGLSGDEMTNLLKLRQQRNELSKEKWLEAQEFVSFANKLPFILGVAVTGSLAVNNVVFDDDIDFMLVTSVNRLWLTRLLVVIHSAIKGKRRSFANEEKNSWCFNLWVEETALKLPKEARSVYEAYEVVQAKWLLSKGHVATKFRQLNLWVHHYLANQSFDFKSLEKSSSSSCFLAWEKLLDFLNTLAFYFQYLYMKPHMTREKVARSYAFFHPRDTKSEVFSNWKRVLGRLR